MTARTREMTAEERRAAVAPAVSAHTFGALQRRVGAWLSGPYATPDQRRSLAGTLLADLPQDDQGGAA